MSGKPGTNESLEPIKAILRSIIVAHSKEPFLTVSKLCQLYRDFEGTSIPFLSYGFRDVNAFLSSMPDVMRLTYSSSGWTIELSGHSNSAHIAKLVAQQKPKDTRRRRRRNRGSRGHSSRQYDNRPRPPPQTNSSSSYSYRCRQRYQSPEYRCLAARSTIGRQNNQQSYSMVPAGFESDVSECDGLHTDNSSSKERRPHEPPQQHQTGTDSSSSRNLKSAPVSSGSLTGSPSITPIQKKKPSRLDVLRNMLNELKLKESQIVPAPPLQVLSSGSDNETAEASAAELPSIAAVKPQNTDCNIDTQLSAKEMPTKHIVPLSEWNYSSDDDSFTEAISTLSHNDPVFLVDIPDNCAELGLEIPPVAFTQNVGDIFQIVVTEAHDPYRFWFQCSSQPDKFDRMMCRINSIYGEMDDRELRIHPLNCIVDHLCMALYDKQWYRAKIIERSNDDTEVKVLYVDFGTIVQIPMANVKYMRVEFTQLPTQACRGCLDFIRPMRTHWLRSATLYFLNLLNDEPVYAKVTSIDNESRLVHMVITNTNGLIDLQVNQKLISAGYAKYYDPYQGDGVRSTVKRHFSEERPTCEMLENGTWPSYDEIGILIEKGFDYYKELEENS